jgi:simple sugar transport system permease protein
VLGGMFWAAIVALLRDRFNANEILVSLMLVYVATFVLSYLVYGPWKDPKGYNFPQTITFDAITKVPRLVDGLRANVGVLIAIVAVGAFWAFLFRTYKGFQLQVGGLAPAAARYAGFSSRGAGGAARGGRGGAGGRCCSRAAWPAWRAGSRPPGRWASSRPTCRPATASPPSSWPTSAACTRWASCSPGC